MAHIPVLMKEVLEYLNPQPNHNFVDCTLGDGGHAAAILERIAPKGRLLGIDLDPEAIENVECRMKNEELFKRIILINDNFKSLASLVAEKNFGPVNGVLLDLGFSTSTLERGRGFSFEKDEPLDMRFNPGQRATAAEIVNSRNKEQLAMILREYGEEPLAKEISEAIILARHKQKIISSLQLSEIILSAYRDKLHSKKEIPWIGGLHPATRTFQALRLAVNDELNNLQEVLPKAVDVLAQGGRLAVISFHSLEDRIVKIFFKSEDKKSIKIITKRPIIAGDEELAENPRSASAKMRVAEKI